jgi:Tfp pilus assembly protein PilW
LSRHRSASRTLTGKKAIRSTATPPPTLLITGYDDAAILFAVSLTAQGAKVLRPGTDSDGETVVGEAWEKATDAFATVRDLLNDIVSAPASASSQPKVDN